MKRLKRFSLVLAISLVMAACIFGFSVIVKKYHAPEYDPYTINMWGTSFLVFIIFLINGILSCYPRSISPTSKGFVLSMSKDGQRNFEKAKIKAGLEDNVQFMNLALTLVDWALDQVVVGRKIASIDVKNNTLRELRSPIFDKINPVI